MSRLAVYLVCLVFVNGLTGCACCSCCPQPSTCCSMGAGYSMGGDAYYPMDIGYEGTPQPGASDCGCAGGGPGMPMEYQGGQMQNEYGSRSRVGTSPRYVNRNKSPKLIQQASMSQWDTTPAYSNSAYSQSVAPRGQQHAGSCNCGN